MKPYREGYRKKKEQQNGSAKYRNKKEGDITITYDPNETRAGNKEVGEYVDYEEVKE